MSSTPKIAKKTVGSYPAISVVTAVTLALVMAGFLALVGIEGNKLLEEFQSGFLVQVVLEQGTEKGAQDTLVSTIQQRPWLGKDGTTPPINFISKEEAAKRFVSETGEDFVGLLEDNPLKDVLEVRIAQPYTGKEAVKQIASELMANPHVEEVVYHNDLLELVNANLQRIGLLLAIVLVILMLGIGLLINNTIRLAMYSQRFLIRSMQLVGASSGFIIKPFLIRSILHSTIATGLAMVLLLTAIQTAISQVPEFASVFVLNDLLLIGCLQFVMGLLLCTGGTYFAVRRYLNMSLDQLY